MMSAFRTGHFAFLLALIAVVPLTGCQEKADSGEKPKTKAAVVNRVNPICRLDVPCNTAEKLWVGPDNSTVHVTLTGAPDCPAMVVLFDRKTEKNTATAATANAGQTVTTAVTVPGTQLLTCSCGGTGQQKCSCIITGVDPPLPPNVVLGPVQAVTPGAPLTDPAAGTIIPIGTPLRLSCGKNFTLWSGPESYVTVTFKGSKTCFAKLKPARIGFGVAGGEEITDDRPFTRTFGPVTSVTASCEGTGAGQCEFEVTETIRLPL